MDYLHQQNIIHGDVHSGNVLLYTVDDQLVAKWADFGLGIVTADRQYRFRRPDQSDLPQKIKEDIYNMGTVFYELMRGRSKSETPQEKQILDEISAMIKELRKDKFNSLAEAHQQYNHLLMDELFLE